MKVLKLSDRISIKQNGLEIVISPLSYEQKIELAGLAKIDAGENVVKTMSQIAKTLKACVKDIKGLTNYDDTPYELSFVDGYLSDECVDEIIQTLGNEEILQTMIKAIGGEMKVEGAEITVSPKK